MSLYRAYYKDGSRETLEAEDIGEARDLAKDFGEVEKVVCVEHDRETEDDDDDEDEDDDEEEDEDDDEEEDDE